MGFRESRFANVNTETHAIELQYVG